MNVLDIPASSLRKLRNLPGWRFLVVAMAAVFIIGYAVRPARAEDTVADLGPLSALHPDVQVMNTLAAAPAPAPATGPAQPPTVREVLLGICQEHGYGLECAKTLYGMMWRESQMDGQAVGDGGRARGYFQIHYRLHHITTACAEDVYCSAEWTLGYMEDNGYPKYANHAIQCHNGCGVKNGYVAFVKAAGQRKWAEADLAETRQAETMPHQSVAVALALPTGSSADHRPDSGATPGQGEYVAALSGREDQPAAVSQN